MPRVAAIALTVAIVAFALPANAQQNIDFSKVEIKTIDLGHNTYRLEGQGGNITVAVGSDGIIMVDGQYAPLHDKIRAAIAAIFPAAHQVFDQHPQPHRSFERAASVRR